MIISAWLLLEKEEKVACMQFKRRKETTRKIFAKKWK